MLDKVFYAVLFMLLTLGAFVALEVVGILPGYSGSFYWFTTPHLILALLSPVFVIVDFKLVARWSVTIASVSMLGLPVTYWFAATRWPGGDDGPGIAWALLVGGFSLVTVLAGIPLLLLGHRVKKHQGKR
jgi:hypothetical protein